VTGLAALVVLVEPTWFSENASGEAAYEADQILRRTPSTTQQVVEGRRRSWKAFRSFGTSGGSCP